MFFMGGDCGGSVSCATLGPPPPLIATAFHWLQLKYFCLVVVSSFGIAFVTFLL